MNTFLASLIHMDNLNLGKMPMVRDANSIFTAEVVDVILNDLHPEWKLFKRRGVIKFRTVNTSDSETKNIISYALPIQLNTTVVPIIGEFVIIVKSVNINSDEKNFLTENVCYYLSLVAAFSDVNSNIIKSALLNDGDPASEKSSESFIEKDIPNTRYYEGYISLEGRFGHSILFGSTVKSANVQSKIGKNENSKNGDPFIIIRNGIQSEEPDINKDTASHYITSTQALDIVNDSFASISEDWTTTNINVIDLAATEVVQESIQDTNSISIDPRSTYTNLSEAIVEEESNEVGSLGIPLYNQGDPRWSKLKSPEETFNMKQAGCAISSLAMACSYLYNSKNITPESLFQVKSKVLVYWNDIMETLNLKYGKNINISSFIKNPKDLESVDFSLQNNIPVLFETKNKDFPIIGKVFRNGILESEGVLQKPYVAGAQHWMLIVAKNDDGTYNLHDPNGGRNRINQDSKFILKKASRFGILSN